MQEDYFEILTKEEVIKAFNDNKQAVYLLYDDNTESEIASIKDIEKHDYKFGIEHAQYQVIINVRNRIAKWHEELLIDPECAIDEVMEQMEYIASL